MADASFDIVSKINMQELVNAVDQAKREITTRFDFKGTKCSLELGKEDLVLVADDDNKMKQLKDVLDSKLIKRNISLKALQYGKVEAAAGSTVRQKATFVSGIPQDIARQIHNLIKDSKLKVKSQSMDDIVRVTGKSRDDLQAVQKLLHEANLTIALQYTNYR